MDKLGVWKELEQRVDTPGIGWVLDDKPSPSEPYRGFTQNRQVDFLPFGEDGFRHIVKQNISCKIERRLPGKGI